MGNRGPQPLPPHQKRLHRVGLYLNGLPGLAELIRARSTQRCGMREISDLIRAKLLAHRTPTRVVVPELNQRVVADLGRVGSNLNQLAHHLNQSALTGSVKTDADAIMAELQDLRDALEDALLGIGSDAPSRAKGVGGIDFGIDC